MYIGRYIFLHDQGRQSGLKSVGAQRGGAENFGVYEEDSCPETEKITSPNSQLSGWKHLLLMNDINL